MHKSALIYANAIHAKTPQTLSDVWTDEGLKWDFIAGGGNSNQRKVGGLRVWGNSCRTWNGRSNAALDSGGKHLWGGGRKETRNIKEYRKTRWKKKFSRAASGLLL